VAAADKQTAGQQTRQQAIDGTSRQTANDGTAHEATRPSRKRAAMPGGHQIPSSHARYSLLTEGVHADFTEKYFFLTNQCLHVSFISDFSGIYTGGRYYIDGYNGVVTNL
jgi:hypothetical protein